MITTHQTLTSLLAQVKDFDAQLTASRGEQTLHLAANKELAPKIWDELFNQALSRPDSLMLTTLLHAAPTSTRAARITEIDDPHTIATALLTCAGKLPPEAISTILSKVGDSLDVAASLILTATLPPELVLSYLSKLEGYQIKTQRGNLPLYFHHLYRVVISTYHLLTDQQIAKDLMDSHDNDLRKLYLSPESVIDLRPGVVKVLLKDRDPLVLQVFAEAIAGSQHITPRSAALLLKRITAPQDLWPIKTPVLQNLALNPSVPRRLKPAVIKELKMIKATHLRNNPEGQRRSLLIQTAVEAAEKDVNSKAPRITTTWDKADPAQLPRVRAALAESSLSYYPTLAGTQLDGPPSPPQPGHLSYEYVNGELTATLSKHGPEAWEIFLATLPTWHGSLEELLSFTTLTATNK